MGTKIGLTEKGGVFLVQLVEAISEAHYLVKSNGLCNVKAAPM